ncbi:MAG: phosphotransferase [Parasporobacterium sp.]|nr:phosphotransferase [Parasporobacterium sp.]
MSIFRLKGRIDSNNAAEIEKEIRAFLPEGFQGELTMDASDLSYVSSAGLRVFLRLKKEIGQIRIIHVNRDVYEILEMTGMNQIIETEKSLRQMEIDGCPEIGRGAHGIVYRIAPDTIVKVYHPGEKIERIRKERELARWAFVKGIPTAIPYDIVRIGDQYGTVFELLNARSASEYVQESTKQMDAFISDSVHLLKQIHAIQADPGELPDMKEQMLTWLGSSRDFPEIREGLTDEAFDQLEQMIRETPDSRMLLHADFHLKNILVCEDELMLIDMDTLCTGDPIFDLATIYNSYREFPSIDAGAAAFLGIDVETAYRICDQTMEQYLSDMDPAGRAEVIKKAQLFGCVRIVAYMNRHDDLTMKEQVVRRCIEDINTILFQKRMK